MLQSILVCSIDDYKFTIDSSVYQLPLNPEVFIGPSDSLGEPRGSISTILETPSLAIGNVIVI